MTTQAAPHPRSRFTGLPVLVSVAAGLGFFAGAAFVEPWQTSDAHDPRVINLTIGGAGPDDRYPLVPSEGVSRSEMTAEEAAAQHEALIDAWLSPSG